MKKAFIVTSIIEPDNSFPLSYNNVRSYFTAQERFRQTIMTVAALDHISDDETTIFLLELSDDWRQYYEAFQYQRNLRFVPIKEYFPEIHKEVLTHKNKSRCESLVLSAFLKKFKKALSEFDYFFKMSGRYFLDSSFKTDIFNEQNIDRIFFKKELTFEWIKTGGYDLVDQRSLQGDNTIRQYVTTIFGWGKEQFNNFLEMFVAMSTILNQESQRCLDIECLIHLFTRQFKEKIIETDWIMYGWQGADGRFVRY